MARGFGVVVSMGYYFNAAPTISSAEQTWEQIYTRDPACYERASRSNCVWNMPAPLWSSFLGAEACQWGEATDEFNLEQKTWWRLPALARAPVDEQRCAAGARRAVCQRLVRRRLPHPRRGRSAGEAPLPAAAARRAGAGVRHRLLSALQVAAVPGVAAGVRGVGAPPDGVSSQSVITTLLPTEHMVHIYTLGLR